MQSSEVFEAAARATINERCAAAFLHDVRGSMQALFSAFELLGRSARMGGGDAVRVEKACDLAKRAILQHEKSTMEILRLLTSQHAEVTTLDLGALVREAVHFLRNDAGNKSVVLSVTAAAGLWVYAGSAKLQTMLVGLLTAAIDHAAPGTELLIAVDSAGDESWVRISSDAGFDMSSIGSATIADQIRFGDLMLLFAHQCMESSRGRLELISQAGAAGTLLLYFPKAAPLPSLAASRVSAMEK